jgi:hypothetical protein
MHVLPGGACWSIRQTSNEEFSLKNNYVGFSSWMAGSFIVDHGLT